MELRRRRWSFLRRIGSDCLTPTHTYTTANLAGYTATLTVRDDELLSDNDTVTITVAPGGGGGVFQDNFTRADNDMGPSPQWAEPVVSSQYTGNLRIGGLRP